jgi:hypothetical protein
MIRKKWFYFVSAVFTAFFYSCSYYQPEKIIVSAAPGLVLSEDVLDVTGVDFPEKSLVVSPGERLKIDFDSDSGKTIKLNKLDNNTVYLLKVNRSSSVIKAQDTGGYISTEGGRSVVRTAFIEGADGGADDPVVNNKAFIRTDYGPAQEFNRNPPHLPSRPRSAEPERAASLGQVGDVKQFWVQNNNKEWMQINATLCATAAHSNVWIAASNLVNSSRLSNDNKITVKQAQNVADKFDVIYEKETALFGYEFGGGLQPTDENYGGKDQDAKIQILVYDIEYDYSPYQNSGAFGYFWGKDYYDAGVANHSNSAEMFYIDSYFLDAIPEGIYAALIHEFQHMINFNVKNLKKGKASETWFDEMLSQVAEDVIGPFIGIDVKNPEHPVYIRLPYFLASYWGRGFVEWMNSEFEESLNSYANTYAFGAYLARNFGGAVFVKDVMESDSGNLNAIKDALEKRGFSFDDALARYGEALVFTDAAHASFNKAVTETINGTDYSFAGFNILNIRNFSAGRYYGGKFTYPALGPVIIDTDFISSMSPYSILIQSCTEWQNTSDALTFKLKKPVDSIDFYIIVK